MDLETAAQQPPATQAWRLKFTGDGGVYFGVWLVNLLLTVVTLGLFTPFARRRKIKYFYAHTVIAGSALEFTGGLRRMFLGYLLFFGLYLAYTIASKTEQNVAAGVLGLGWLLLMPWLWVSAQRFRLASTRWRGIRGRFDASTGQAYAASWPLLALGALGAAFGVAVALSRGRQPGVPGVLGIALAGVLALLVLVLRLDFNYTRLHLTRSSFGGERSRWKGRFGELLRFSAAAFGLYLAVMAALVALVAGGVFFAGGAALAAKVQGKKEMLVLAIVAGSFAILFAVYLAAGPALAYREARKFAWVWNSAGLGDVARFRCDLNAWAFVRLRVKNVLMSMLTFGFWRPFALTSEYRMKLESVTLHVKGGLDQLAGQLAQQQGAFADAIADAVGLDLIG